MNTVEYMCYSQVLLVSVVFVFFEVITTPATIPAIIAAIRRAKRITASARNFDDLEENHLKQ